MLTRKAGLTIAFALWILALGLALRNSLLLVSAVPVVVYVVLLHLTETKPHLNVRVERSSSQDAVYEGEAARFTLRVENLGPRLAALEVYDTLEGGLEPREGSSHIITALERGETRSFVYSIGAPVFGSYTLGPIRLRSTDLARNHAEETTVSSSTTLWVYPEVRYLNKVAIRPRRPRN